MKNKFLQIIIIIKLSLSYINIDDDEEDFYMINLSEKEVDPYNFTNDTEKLYYFSSALINKSNYNLNIIESESYSQKFIESINYNFRGLYMNKKLYEKYPEKSGIFIGLGLNLGNKKDLNFLSSRSVKNKLRIFLGKNGSEAKKLLNKTNKKSAILTVPEFKTFNEEILKYYLKELKINNYLKKRKYISPILATYPQLIFEKDEFLKNIQLNKTEILSNLINFSTGGARFSRKICSIFLSSENVICNNGNHIIFIIGYDINLKERISLINTLQNLIKETKHAYSIIAVNETNFIRFNINDTLINDISQLKCEKKECKINLKIAFDETKKLIGSEWFDYHMKNTIVIFANSPFETEENIKLINNMKKDDYNIIIYANQSIDLTYLNDKNIIYLQNFSVFNYYKDSFKSTICYLPIQIMLKKNSNLIKNLHIEDIKSPHYFKVITNSNENITYNLSFKIKNQNESYYNIFVSRINPFPDIKSYHIKHYGIGNSTPEIYINAKEIFYISVIGDNITYDLFINKLKNKNKYILPYSNGLFSNKEFNISIKQIGNDYLTFTNNYYLNTLKFNANNEANENIINILKYCRRGINREDTIDNDFLNIDLLIFFKSIINVPYIDNNTNYSYIGNYFRLKDISPSVLMNQNFSIILINKLYPILSISYNNNSVIRYYLEKENIQFSDKEAISLFILNKEKEISKISRIIGKNSLSSISGNLKFLFYLTNFLLRNKSQKLIKHIYNKENEEILTEMKYNDNNFKLFTSYIYDIEQKDENELNLISFVIEKSLLKSKIIYNFINEIHQSFYVSISTYNNKTGKIEMIYNFISNKVTINFNDYIDNTIPNESSLDFIKIIDHQINFFNKYDKGNKKILVLIADENLIENNTKFNHPLININQTKINKTDINFILITSKKYSFNDKFFQYNNFTYFDNIFYIKNFYQKDNYYIKEFRKLILNLPIKLICDSNRILTNFNFDEKRYYEIVCDGTLIIYGNNTEDFLVFKNKYYYPNYISSLIGLNGDLNTDNYKFNHSLFFNEYRYLTFISLNKQYNEFKLSKSDSNQRSNKTHHIQIIITFLLIIGLFIFAYFSVQIKKGKKRKNNFR